MIKPLLNFNSPLITVGRITGAFGIRGWVHLTSFTSPENNLFQLKPLYLALPSTLQEIHIKAHKPHQKSWVVQVEACEDRDQALAWKGVYIQVERAQLPALPKDQHYWADLEGLAVINMQNELLGHVEYLFNTGANDIMAVKKGSQEFYIPFVQPHIIKLVDIEKKVIRVEWEE